MKILIANTYYYPNILGGAEISVKKLAEELANRGHEVHIICTDKVEKNEILNKVIVHRIKPVNVTTPIQLGEVSKAKIAIYRVIDLNNKLNIKGFNKLIKSINPDIAHINNIPGLSISLWKALEDNGVPIIHTLRDYYLVCPKINLLNKNWDICKESNQLCKIYRKYNKKVFEMDTCITSPSESTLKIFKGLGMFNESKDSKVVYNAIDFNIDDTKKIAEEKLKRTYENVKFVYIGSLHEHKGIKWLIETFVNIQNPNIQLHIAGSGPLKGYLEEQIKLDKRIIYHGFLNEDGINKLLQECDVSIVPSIWYEPFGRVVIDGYKNALPVIGSDIGGISEIIYEGETGALVESKSQEELTNIINKFSNREIIKSHINNCVSKLNRFSLSNQVDEFEKIYKSYIEKGR